METIPETNGNVTEVETVENVVIKTEKVEKNGVQHRRIISVEGCITEIEAKSLPGYVRYMAGQAVYLTRFGIGEEQADALQMFGHKRNVPHLVVGVGREIREDLFQNAVRHIGLALNRLRIIKEKQAMTEKWEGDETITVMPTIST